MNRFRHDDAQRIFSGHTVRRLPADIQRRARVRLQRVVAAVALTDLQVPPSHRLKALRGDREGQYSLRINHQWRVCFIWTDQGAMEIEVTDYH
ncbi:MAG: type II toxin-antitoxin system RelE/ParE family toxin [bacterium]|nr:type II toxin-antitoxin system RelE/ParE family toxin [Acidimicrobiia bacterium]MCY4650174.1 type II toxin-antitoxin system RelE/ParE family toxin [bacterium]